MKIIPLAKAKKIKKVKKPKARPLSYYRNKADKLLQELVRSVYNKCLVCDGQISCGHHYYPKSSAGNLRYHFNNLIPICQGCHFRHHNGDPRIQNTINEEKGQEWLDSLNEAKKEYIKCNTKEYYKSICNKLTLCKNEQPPTL